jgi:PHD/YefM family antitoxin component YafN of YafNO toxin-antitoxin module
VQKHVPYLLTRGNRPVVVLIPYDHYVRLTRAAEAGVLKRFDALLERMARVNTAYPNDEVEADLREAAKVVRARERN